MKTGFDRNVSVRNIRNHSHSTHDVSLRLSILFTSVSFSVNVLKRQGIPSLRWRYLNTCVGFFSDMLFISAVSYLSLVRFCSKGRLSLDVYGYWSASQTCSVQLWSLYCWLQIETWKARRPATSSAYVTWYQCARIPVASVFRPCWATERRGEARSAITNRWWLRHCWKQWGSWCMILHQLFVQNLDSRCCF